MNKSTYLYQIMLLLLCSVVFNSTVFGQTKKAPPAPRVYKLQIAAYREINFAKNVKGLDTIGTLFIEDDPSGIYRVVMGYYKDAAEAKAALANVRQAGYENAYLTTQALNAPLGVDVAKVFSSDNPEEWFAANEPAETETPPAQEQTVADKPPKKEAKVAIQPPPTQEIEAKEQNMSDKATNTETTPKEELVANNKEAYAIDLGSFEQIGDIRLGTLNGLGDLFTNPRNHVMIGIYEEEDEAAENLNVVKKNGFKYATITSEVAASIFKNQSKTTTPASPAKKTMAPPEPKPEAVFTPAKPKDTTPTQPAPSAKKATNTEQTTPKPENYSTNTTAKAAADFKKFDGIFAEVEFDLFKVDAYDPTQETISASTTDTPEDVARNQQLKGEKIDPALWYIANQTPKEPNWNMYGLYKFKLDNEHSAYVIRSGKKTYQNDNFIDLYVYNEQQKRFVTKENLSQVWSTPSMMGITQSWILDLNNDGVLDFLSYVIEENSQPEKGYQTANKFVGKVWLNKRFVDVKINNQEILKQQLGITE
jgi:hypothetical protein